MKFRSLFLALALLALPAVQAVADTNPSSYTNFWGGIGVGSVGTSNTYVVLTGVAEVYHRAPLTSILTGTNGTTALADTAITTGLFVGQASSLTNHAAVIFPVDLDTSVASISFNVPYNYRSGGHLVIGAHTNSTFTAGTISMTADAYSFMYNGTTSTAITVGTPIQLGQGASAWCITQTVTNAIGLTPMAQVTYKLRTTRTSKAAQVQLTDAWFVYRPWGVLNGK